MKKYLLIISLLAVAAFSPKLTLSVSAKITPTVAPNPTQDGINLQKQVDALKSKIASKVAELNLVEKRGLYGTVTDATTSQITLRDLNNQTRFIDVDELTKFSSSVSDTFGISDVKKGMILGILGIYNKDSERLQARVVNQENPLPQFAYGAVISTDKTNYNLIIAKENGLRNLVDIETVTKIYAFSGGTLAKSGFSKILDGEPIIVIGFYDAADKNKIIGSRIILFPDITPSAKIDLTKILPTTVSSTGSGIKLQPISK